MLSNLLYFIGVVFVKTYSKLMLKLDIRYHAPMPKGVKIIVVNHPTTSDPFVITSLTKGQAGILIRDVLFNVPLFGKYLEWSGHISVIPSKGKEAFDRAVYLLNQGISVVVFIEGDLTGHEDINRKPRTGTVRLAMVQNVPIIPVGVGIKKENVIKVKSVIKGRKEVGSWYLSGPYAITVGKSIRIRGSIKNRERVRRLSETVMQEVNKLTDESTLRIVQ